MKRYILLFFAFFMFVGCVDTNERFIGYIVAKEYTPTHMDNENVKSISYLGVVYVPHVVYHRSPKKVEQCWEWYVANKYTTKRIKVSKEIFNSKKCGDKVEIYLQSIY